MAAVGGVFTFVFCVVAATTGDAPTLRLPVARLLAAVTGFTEDGDFLGDFTAVALVVLVPLPPLSWS